MKISVIIPVLNEEKTIEKILNKVLEQKEVSEIVIVNDGSTDNTQKILTILQKKSKRKIRMFCHPQNAGKGAAIRTGLKNAKGDFLIIQDADLEYNPNEYRKLLDKITKNSVVFGSRIIANNPHAYTRTYLGNVLITSFHNLLFGTKLTDIYTCYKLFPAHIAKKLKLRSNGFEVEAEITAKLAKKGINIVEVPISYKPRSYEKGKKIKAKDALIGALTLLKVRLCN